MEGYARCLESKKVDWDVNGNVEEMWEQGKRAMADSAREVCGLVRGGERTQRMYGGMMW